MNEREALLRAVLEAPEDDVPRLVYADWLEEHGEAERAEFVRWHCANSTTQFERADGWNRIGLGVAVPAFAWRVLDGLLSEVGQAPIVVRRGFVACVVLRCAAFLRRAEFLFATHPITEVWLSDRTQPRWFRTRLLAWQLEPRFGWRGAQTLPRDLFDRLTGGQLSRQAVTVRYYPTARAADAALSRACVAYGRELAGLPPLPAQVPGGSSP